MKAKQQKTANDAPMIDVDIPDKTRMRRMQAHEQSAWMLRSLLG
jgi:hypothetical protein